MPSPIWPIGSAYPISACSRRIQRLEEDGYIARRVVLLDRPLMGLPTTMFVIVRTARHSAEWLEQFRKAISDIPEIVEVHRMTGTIDYILKLVLPRVEAYDEHLQGAGRKGRVFRHIGVRFDGNIEGNDCIADPLCALGSSDAGQQIESF